MEKDYFFKLGEVDTVAASRLIAQIADAPVGIRDIAKQFGELKKAHEAASAIVKALGDAWDECEKELIEEMIDEGVSSIKIEGYGNFILSQSTYPNVNAASKPQFFEYLKASGNGGLLKLDVPSQTLTAFLKRHVEELKKQFVDDGITTEQATLLADYAVSGGSGEGGEAPLVEYPYSDAAKSVGQPVDEMTADDLAKALLKSQGAAMFTKKGISLRK